MTAILTLLLINIIDIILFLVAKTFPSNKNDTTKTNINTINFDNNLVNFYFFYIKFLNTLYKYNKILSKFNLDYNKYNIILHLFKNNEIDKKWKSE